MCLPLEMRSDENTDPSIGCSFPEPSSRSTFDFLQEERSANSQAHGSRESRDRGSCREAFRGNAQPHQRETRGNRPGNFSHRSQTPIRPAANPSTFFCDRSIDPFIHQTFNPIPVPPFKLFHRNFTLINALSGLTKTLEEKILLLFETHGESSHLKCEPLFQVA